MSREKIKVGDKVKLIKNDYMFISKHETNAIYTVDAIHPYNDNYVQIYGDGVDGKRFLWNYLIGTDVILVEDGKKEVLKVAPVEKGGWGFE